MTEAKRAQATLGGGCFWCLEAVFQQLRGVHRVVSGYAGGKRPNPSYQQVCSGATGHAEVVQITFDPDQISYADLLRVFFVIHDPTTLNRQGADIGTQYRSVIFTHDDQQAETAREIMAEVAADWPAPLVTEVTELPAFYPAEPEHQDYYRQHGAQPYCRMVIAPKLGKAQAQFRHLLAK